MLVSNQMKQARFADNLVEKNLFGVALKRIGSAGDLPLIFQSFDIEN